MSERCLSVWEQVEKGRTYPEPQGILPTRTSHVVVAGVFNGQGNVGSFGKRKCGLNISGRRDVDLSVISLISQLFLNDVLYIIRWNFALVAGDPCGGEQATRVGGVQETLRVSAHACLVFNLSWVSIAFTLLNKHLHSCSH